VTAIKDGFDFLGATFRTFKDEGKKAGEITLSMPSKESIKKMRKKIAKTIKESKTLGATALISKLNPKIRGWANYFRITSAKSTFTGMDNYI